MAAKIPVSGTSIVSLEEHLIAQEGRCNFAGWAIGTVTGLVMEPMTPHSWEIIKQGVLSLMRVIEDLVFENAIALNNVRHWRRDFLIGRLPAVVTDGDKRRLQDCSISTKYLFDEDVLAELEKSYDSRILRNLVFAASKAKGNRTGASPLTSHPYEA